MRLEEYTPEYAINYHPADIASMRRALKRYTELIQTGDAFTASYCVAHFYHTGDNIPFSTFDDHPDLQKYLMEDAYYFHKDSDMDNLQASMTGEDLLFLCAVIHPELEEDIKTTCEAMVRYARELNDSSEMWITVETPFGIEPLHIVATRYPKYGYLLASFLVPNWDDEHMHEPLFRLAAWKNNLGITEDTLKAFCYADNATVRENMLGYDSYDGYDDSGDPIESNFDLITHFREHPDAYDTFKQMLADRYREMPFLQYSKDLDEYNETPLRTLVMEMLYVQGTVDFWDDDFDADAYLSQPFVTSDAKLEAEELKADVEQRLGRPIVLSLDEKEQNKALEDQVKGQQVTPQADAWQEVITKVLPDGEALWHYIVTGERPEVLDAVKKTDLAKGAKKNKCAMARDLALQAKYAPMEKWIFREIGAYAKECLKQDPILGKEQIFRFYDVMHRCMASPPIYCETRRGLVDELNIATNQELEERFPTTFKKQFEVMPINIRDWYQFSDLHRTLPQVFRLLQENEKKATPYLLEWFALENPKAEEKGKKACPASPSAAAVMASYLAVQGSRAKAFGDLTAAAIAYLEEYGPRFILSCLGSQGQWTLYEEYVSEKDAVYDTEYQQNYQKKVLQNYHHWKPVEHYVRTGQFDKLSGQEAMDAFVAYFNWYAEIDDDEIAKRQPRYGWIDGSRDETTLAMVMAYWAVQIPSLKGVETFRRFLKIAFQMAPMKVISQLSGMLPALENIDDMDLFMDTLSSLKPLGLEEDAYWSYQLYRIYDDGDVYDIDPERPGDLSAAQLHYLQLLTLYLEGIAPAQAMKKSSPYLDAPFDAIRSALRQGVHRLSRRHLMKIYRHATRVLGSQEGITAELDKMALDKMRRSLGKNIARLPQYFEARLKQHHTFCDEESVSGDELKDFLVPEYPPSDDAITEDRYEEIKAEILEDHQHAHYQWCVIQKTARGMRFLCNAKMLRFGLWCNEHQKDDRITAYHLFIADESCPQELIEDIEALQQMDYKAAWMERFDDYLSGEVGFESIQTLVECGISDDEFLEADGFDDIDLEDIIDNLSPNLQERLVKIAEAKDVDLM
ncbi:hypothetical protein [Desulfoluna spongiiphila]|uniref:hypothetical protein n=1 Tax=Desulfoluna spongiiphila TaxID=419481 RepID=UPI0012538C73|nr:hypothetical protein [Desulfoluna spongiiphila]VVS94032.1 hypothetical protein DBB_36040 [Desulfoluna spongiiphila]